MLSHPRDSSVPWSMLRFALSLTLSGTLSVTLFGGFAVLGGGGVGPSSVAIADEPLGTLARPIIDSQMSEAEAFAGLDPRCPEDIRQRQRLVDVLYYSHDNRIHRGQLVLDHELVADIQKVFAVALKEKFPIASVIPISHPRFRKEGRWDDDLSMAANNTSAFNYRRITGGTRLSNHAHGRAIDINPLQNPYVKGNLVLPPGAEYDVAAVGTITAESPITMKFADLGWEWGGVWESRKDYQHFEKPRPDLRSEGKSPRDMDASP